MPDKSPEQEPSIEEILASIRQIISDDDVQQSPPEKTAQTTRPAQEPVVLQAADSEPLRETDLVLGGPEKGTAFPESDLDLSQKDLEEQGFGTEEDILELTDPLPEDDLDLPPGSSFHVDLRETGEEGAFEEDDLQELDQALLDIPVGDVHTTENPKERSESFMEDMSDHSADISFTPESIFPAPIEDIITDEARNAALASLSKLAGSTPVYRNRQLPAAGAGVTVEDIVRDLLQPMLKEWVSTNLPPIVERAVQRELDKLARQAIDT